MLTSSRFIVYKCVANSFLHLIIHLFEALCSHVQRLCENLSVYRVFEVWLIGSLGCLLGISIFLSQTANYTFCHSVVAVRTLYLWISAI